MEEILDEDGFEDVSIGSKCEEGEKEEKEEREEREEITKGERKKSDSSSFSGGSSEKSSKECCRKVIVIQSPCSSNDHNHEVCRSKGYKLSVQRMHSFRSSMDLVAKYVNDGYNVIILNGNYCLSPRFNFENDGLYIGKNGNVILYSGCGQLNLLPEDKNWKNIYEKGTGPSPLPKDLLTRCNEKYEKDRTGIIFLVVIFLLMIIAAIISCPNNTIRCGLGFLLLLIIVAGFIWLGSRDEHNE